MTSDPVFLVYPVKKKKKVHNRFDANLGLYFLMDVYANPEHTKNSGAKNVPPPRFRIRKSSQASIFFLSQRHGDELRREKTSNRQTEALN